MTTVRTQAELDAALASGDSDIIIASPRGVWLSISGSATVRASDMATVSAYGSATVEAYGSATVRAYGSATVWAYGMATVSAYGSATVEASGSATVEASGSATVKAYGSATVSAYGSATVKAGTHVAVRLRSTRVTLTGGVVIDMTTLDLTDPAQWLGYHGVTVADGEAILYKAVGDDWCTDRGSRWTYAPGATVTADDWAPTRKCGQGLHFGVTPRHARRHHDTATRYVAVAVDVATLVPLDDKAKAPSCRVLVEVDIDGRAITAAATEEDE